MKKSLIGELTSGVQAFFLLMSANLPDNIEKLARATANLDYTDMKDKLMKIFGDPGVLDSGDNAPEIKEEVMFGGFVPRGRGTRRRGRGGGRGGTNVRGGSALVPAGASGGASASSSLSTSGTSILRCYACQEPGHIARNCPNREEVYEQGISMHITLVSSQSSQLLREALGKGVLDSGCSSSLL